MGFELPLALAGLAGALVPLLVHLVRRRDLRVQRLPTLHLLERAVAESRRRVRLADWLLLLLRMLIFAALAVAIARPFVAVPVAYGDGRVASLVIVLDDSMSMGARSATAHGTLLDAARTAARAALAGLPPGSEAALVLAGAPPRLAVGRTEDLSRLRHAIDALPERTVRSTALPGAVARARAVLTGARYANRRLLVLSDYARHVDAEAIRWPGTDVDVQQVRLRATTEPNFWLVAADVAADPTAKESVSVRVRAAGSADREAIPLVLTRGDQVLARGELSIKDGAGQAVLHTNEPAADDADATAVSLRVEDALEADNTLGVLLQDDSATRLLLVDGDPHAARSQDELGFLTQALDAAPRSAGRYEYRVADANRLESVTLSGVDVIVLANVPAPSALVASRLIRFVERGGGLWITAGDQVDGPTYAARFGDLLPVDLGRAGAPGDGDRRGLDAAGAHTTQGLARTQTSERLEATPSLGRARVWYRFHDGTVALAEGDYVAGRVAVLTTTVDDAWTDLPFQPGFLPLALDVLRTLAPRGGTTSHELLPGQAVELTPPRGVKTFRVRAPDGTTHDLPADAPSRFEGTLQLGTYQVFAGGAPLPRADFVVRPDPAESELTPIEPPTLPGRAKGASAGRAVARAGVPLHRPVGRWFFVLAGVFVLLEGVVRTRIR